MAPARARSSAASILRRSSAAIAAGEPGAGPLPAKMLAMRRTARLAAPREMLLAVAGLMAPAASTAAALTEVGEDARTAGAEAGFCWLKKKANPEQK